MTSPPLAVGMPVFNGENFLESTLASILGQSFGDFELAITDNASTDGTEEICREAAAGDSRIVYHRHEQNLGAGPNYRSCYELTSAPLFKWAAHDDPCGPTLFERSVEALESHPDAVLAFARVVTLDASGTETRRWRSRPALSSPDPRTRTRDILDKQETFPVFGVIRRSALDRTILLGDFIEHDRPLLYQLALHGPFVEIPEPLFFDREHPARSVRAFDQRDGHVAALWFDATADEKLIFPRWRLLGEHFRALHRSPIPFHRSGPELVDLVRWGYADRDRLLNDLVVAGERIPGLGPRIRATADRARTRRWDRTQHRAVEQLTALAGDTTVVLIDEATLDREQLTSVDLREFPADDHGDWFGLPTNSAEAIDALERSRRDGATHVAVAGSSRWWLDHYDVFAAHLAEVTEPLVDTDEIIIYRLKEAAR